MGSMQAKLSDRLLHKLQLFGLELVDVTACRPQLALPAVKLAKLFGDGDQVGKNLSIDILGHLILYTLSDRVWGGRVHFQVKVEVEFCGDWADQNRWD